jgi:threonine dehydrogenase-like Zn-dependent dehydrogenase
MKAIVNTAPGECAWLDLPMPEPGQGQVRIRSAACSICATDLQMIIGWERTGFPTIPGHEWSGIVDAVGAGVDSNLLGQPCVGENILDDGGEIGFEHPGAYGQYFLCTAKNLYLLGPDLPINLAVLVEPISVIIRGYQHLDPKDAEEVFVFGDGPIGLLVAYYLKQSGIPQVNLIGKQPRRLEVGRKLGIDRTYDIPPGRDDVIDEIRREPGHEFGYLIEASGSLRALEAALKLAERGSRILVLGDYGAGKANFAWNDLLHKELVLTGSNTGAGYWQAAVDFLQAHHNALETLLTHTVPAVRFQEGLDIARHQTDQAIKVVLAWNSAENL